MSQSDQAKKRPSLKPSMNHDVIPLSNINEKKLSVNWIGAKEDQEHLDGDKEDFVQRRRKSTKGEFTKAKGDYLCKVQEDDEGEAEKK